MPGMIVLLAAAFLCAGFGFYYAMRYNLHMFQQNGYKMREHAAWIKNNFNRQRFLLLLPVAAVPYLFLAGKHFTAAAVIMLIVQLPVLFGYVALKKSNTKKKFVFTARVKRLIGTDVVVNVLLTVLAGVLYGKLTADPSSSADGMFLLNTRFMPACLVLLSAAQPWVVLLCNILNKPAEKAVNDHFINDAKRILGENKGLTVIGVTGSYGKTSLKFFLRDLLSERFNVYATPESYNTPMGVVKSIREDLKPTHEIFICEMGAKHVGDIREICDIVHPDHGVITSVGPQHLETFGTIENVRKTKFELADSLSDGGKLFLNGDSEEILKDTKERNRIFYGIENASGYRASDIVLSTLGTDFTVTAPDGESGRFHMQLIGSINVLNVLGAIAVANSFGICLADLKVPVRRLKPVRHRLELLDRGAFTIIDDAYNSNPVGSKAAVETLGMFDGARILVTPGMVELGAKEKELHYAFGQCAAKNCDYILLVNSYRTKDIMQGALDGGFPKERIFEFDKFNEAMNLAVSLKDDRRKYILLENDLPDNF